MKLLYVSDHRFIKNKHGEIYTTGQMSETYFDRFRDSFDTVTVIGLCEDETISNQGKEIEKVNLYSEFLEYKFIKSSGTIWGRVSAIRKIKQEYIKLLNSYDRVATKSPSLVNSFVVKFARKKRIPILIEVVGCPWDALWNHSTKGKLVAPYMWSLTRKAVKNAPYTLYVTNEFLQQRYPSRGKTLGCSDVALPVLDKKTLQNRINKIKSMDQNKPIIIGTIGSVEVKYKGQEYVIEAISRLNKQGFNYEYYLVGGGDDSYLKSIARKYEVLNKVKFLGALPHEKVFRFIDSIDLYIQPSKTEGLPRSLVESMSRGCPSLGSITGGIPELLNKEFSFNNGEIQEICELLKTMDRKVMLSEAERSYKKAQEFDKELLEEKRRNFYQEFARKTNLS